MNTFSSVSENPFVQILLSISKLHSPRFVVRRHVWFSVQAISSSLIYSPYFRPTFIAIYGKYFNIRPHDTGNSHEFNAIQFLPLHVFLFRMKGSKFYYVTVLRGRWKVWNYAETLQNEWHIKVTKMFKFGVCKLRIVTYSTRQLVSE